MDLPHFTVWRCESAASGQVVHRIEHSYAGEGRDAHAYQRPIWSGFAATKHQAAALAGVEACNVSGEGGR